MRSLVFCLGLLLMPPLAAQETVHDWAGDGEPPGYSTWLENDRPDPPTAAGSPFESPPEMRGGLDIYNTLGEFQAATGDLGGLDHEDFDRNQLVAGQAGECFDPVDERSDDPCFRPGDLAGGFQIRSSWGSFNQARLVLLDPGVLGTPTPVIGTNAFNDPGPNPTRIDFPGGPTAVAMDVYDGILADPVAITVFADDDSVIGNHTITPAATNEPVFTGMVSPVPISHIKVVGTSVGSGELIGNLRFGGGPGRLVLEPAAVDFGPVAAGEVSGVLVEVFNEGYLALELGAIDSLSAPFDITGDACSGATLAPGAGCQLDLAFAPASGIDAAGELEIQPVGDPSSRSLTIAGRGVVPEVVASPALVAFETDAGTPVSQMVEIVNRSPVAADLADMAGAEAPFQHSGGTCAPIPFELAPGQSCSLEFTFDPPAAGEFPVAVTMSSGTGMEQVRIHLSGTATGE